MTWTFILSRFAGMHLICEVLQTREWHIAVLCLVRIKMPLLTWPRGVRLDIRISHFGCKRLFAFSLQGKTTRHPGATSCLRVPHPAPRVM